MAEPSHDLFGFLRNEGRALADEYERLQRRLRKQPLDSEEGSRDAGTAGDQGEENWADLLRHWLPSGYRVVTKGQLLSHRQLFGKQFDVIVLRPSYPPCLDNKKYYLAGGVAAAFECKLTLHPEHIKKAKETAAQLRRLLPKRFGTPYRELNSGLLYGLLAHSHDWKDPNSTPIENVRKHLYEDLHKVAEHPREVLDFVCVADLATWGMRKSCGVFKFLAQKMPAGPEPVPNWAEIPSIVRTLYMEPTPGYSLNQGIAPVAMFVYRLLNELAWEDPALRNIAEYFYMTGIPGNTTGSTAEAWELGKVFTDKVGRLLEQGKGSPFVADMFPDDCGHWSEWSLRDDVFGQ